VRFIAFKIFLDLMILGSGLKAQKMNFDFEFGGGFAPEYNFQTKSFGLEGKWQFNLGRLGITPKYTYFPSTLGDSSFYTNNIQERLMSLGLQYNVTPNRRFHAYVLAQLTYGHWMDHDESILFNVNSKNLYPQVGLGIMRAYGCFRPYGDFTYNTQWKEGSVRIGVLWFPFHCTSPKDNHCPAFN
jgi:hypothetical protein